MNDISSNTNHLNTRQKYAFDMMKQRKNIFLSGAAGTGKSYTLKVFINHCIKNNIPYAITSTTGVSALLVGGITLHSWSGVLLGMEDKITLLERVRSRDKAYKRWLYTKVLVVDEISMLNPVLLEKLDYIGKKIRKSNKPFGGIQLIFCGDFAQLPPVKSDYCFKSAIWDLLIDKTIYLIENMRQTHGVFKKLLAAVRMGNVTYETVELLKTRIGAYIETPEGIVPTKLFSHRAVVAKTNHDSLIKLVTPNNPIVTFHAKDNVRRKDGRMVDSRYRDQYLGRINKIFQAIKTLQLCIGAQVMLLFNLDLQGGLANGSRGVVIGFTNGLPIVRFMNGVETPIDKASWSMKISDTVVVSRKQTPLILAWAITIHKCISGDTLVSDQNGLKEISKYSNTEGWSDVNVPINTFVGIETATKVYKGEMEPSIKITTQLGYTLEGSYRHPIMTQDHQWILLPEVEIGTSLAMQNNNKCGRDNNLKVDFGDIKMPKEIDEKLSYMIGLLVGNGCYENHDGTVEFCGSSLNYYQQLIKEIFGITCDTKIVLSGLRPFHTKHNKVYFCHRKLRDFLYNCGLKYVTSHNKKVPWVILENTLECQRSFLQGLYGKTFIDPTFIDPTFIDPCNYTTTSSKLASHVHMMLLNLGIISNKSRNKTPNHKKLWTISITDRFEVKYKQDALNKSNTANIIMFFDTVAKIEYGECMMYDFEVPGSHSFISNGFVSHNCQGSTLDCAQMDLGATIFSYGQAYTALSRVKSLEAVSIVTLDPDKLVASPCVIDFYNKIEAELIGVAIPNTTDEPSEIPNPIRTDEPNTEPNEIPNEIPNPIRTDEPNTDEPNELPNPIRTDEPNQIQLMTKLVITEQIELPIPDEKLCPICYEREIDSIIIPCGHIYCCLQCNYNLDKCPICRGDITMRNKIYIV